MQNYMLRSYRELLSLIKRLPADQQAQALQEARQQMRSNALETDALKLSDMHKQLVGRVSFLRSVTPRTHTDRRASGSFVYRGGKLVEAQAHKESRSSSIILAEPVMVLQIAAALSGNPGRLGNGKLTPNEVHEKHHSLLKRQYFGRQPPRIREPF